MALPASRPSVLSASLPNKQTPEQPAPLPFMPLLRLCQPVLPAKRQLEICDSVNIERMGAVMVQGWHTGEGIAERSKAERCYINMAFTEQNISLKRVTTCSLLSGR